MNDPLARERQAREELVADLIASEREARHQMAMSGHWADTRRKSLHELHRLLGTWQNVADATGQKLSAITKAAYKRPQERNAP